MKNKDNDIICVCCCSEKIDFFFRKENSSYYKCSNCDLVFIYPIPNNLEEVYTKEYFTGGKKGFGYTDYEKDKEPMKNVFIKYLDLIEDFYPQKGNLLDIGAASGYFMNIAKYRGWNVRGIEISDFAAANGRSKGLDIVTGTIGSTLISKNVFDVITMWDVLEHLPNPQEDLKNLNAILKHDGLLAINTPDSSSWYSKILGSKWHLYIPREHIFHYNPKSLNFLGERLGFKMLLSTKIGKKFTIQYVVVFIENWLKIKKMTKIKDYILNTNIGKISIPINLRDNFVAILKKQDEK